MKEICTDHQRFYACITSNTVLCVSVLFEKKITNELMINFSQSHIFVFFSEVNVFMSIAGGVK